MTKLLVSLKEKYIQELYQRSCKTAAHKDGGCPTNIDVAGKMIELFSADLIGRFDDDCKVVSTNSDYNNGRRAGLVHARMIIKQLVNVDDNKLKRDDRVIVKSGFNVGAHGVVEFVQPCYNVIWVLRDNASSPVSYRPDELERE